MFIILHKNHVTQIKLLVVIMITSLLVAILVPAFSKAQAIGRQQCAYQTRNRIGLAMIMHVKDHVRGYIDN